MEVALSAEVEAQLQLGRAGALATHVIVRAVLLEAGCHLWPKALIVRRAVGLLLPMLELHHSALANALGSLCNLLRGARALGESK